MRLLIFFLLWIGFGVCNADALKWLDKMGVALREQNYVGTFIYMRGSLIETAYVEHQFHNGREFERLTHLNGEPRVIVRRDNNLVCNNQKSETNCSNHNISLGPFSAAFNKNLVINHEQYRFSMHGRERIAGRSAVKIKITPRFGDRFGYRLWLDEESSLPLQSQLFQRNRILEVFQFSSLEMGQQLDKGNLDFMEDDTFANRVVVEPQEEEVIENPSWRVSWLPAGFKPVRAKQSDRLHFTDGLAGLSVFVERKRSLLPEITTYLGATTLITRRLNGTQGQITVVGEIPIDTARKIADSVERVIY